MSLSPEEGLSPSADLLVHAAATVRPVEIKSAMTFHRNLVRNLETFAREEPAADVPTLLYDGAPVPSFGPRNVSVRAALVYDGELAPAVEAHGYFDALVPASRLLELR